MKISRKFAEIISVNKYCRQLPEITILSYSYAPFSRNSQGERAVSRGPVQLAVQPAAQIVVQQAARLAVQGTAMRRVRCSKKKSLGNLQSFGYEFAKEGKKVSQ